MIDDVDPRSEFTEALSESRSDDTVCNIYMDYLQTRGLYKNVVFALLNIFGTYYISRDARKPVFGVSDNVQHKPACTVIEDS